MSHLVDALERAYRVLGLQDAAGGDRVFWHLVLARIIEPASKLDSLRVLQEAGGDGGVLPQPEAAPAGLCGVTSSGRSAEGAGRRPRRAAPPPRTATLPTSSRRNTKYRRG
jgi:hypothetical protein